MIPAFTKYRSAASSYVLDSLSVSAVGAFSLRRLRAAYTGAAINVRRSSDNATTDIGFTSAGDLDTTSLLAFAGSGNAFIVTQYDQSGNGANATQAVAANQPQIVNAGAVITQNTKPSPQFYIGGTISSLLTTINAFSSGYALNAVVINTGSQAYVSITDKSTASGIGAPWQMFGQYGNWNRLYVGNGSVQSIGSFSIPYNTLSVITHQILASSLAGTVYGNGTQALSQTWTYYADTTNPVTIGRRGDSANWLQGNLSELTLFAAPLSTTDRQTLERNQGSYYGITVA